MEGETADVRCCTALDGPALAIPSGASVGAAGCPCSGQFCTCWSHYSASHLQHEAMHFLRYVIILTVPFLYFSPPTLSLNSNFVMPEPAFPFAVLVTATRPVTGMSNLWRHFIHSAPNTASGRTLSLLQLTDSVQAVIFLFADTFLSFVRLISKIQRAELRPWMVCSPATCLDVQSLKVAQRIDYIYIYCIGLSTLQKPRGYYIYHQVWR